MEVAITGASGFVGQALIRSLVADGHEVRRLVRSEERAEAAGAFFWDPEADVIDPSALSGAGAVVHLAGTGVADKRWTEARKRLVLETRTRGTSLVARTMAQLDDPPPTLISASAIGYYGDRDDEVLTEASEPGEGFLAELVQAWEESAEPASQAGIRVAHLRSGVVLGRDGGMLGAMLLPFQLGLGGRFGSGQQWMSWITLEDELRAIRFLLDTDSLRGPVNLTAPEPVRNRELTAALGRALRRPTMIPTPPFLLYPPRGRELVQEVMLVSQRVVPELLTGSGFEFRHPDIASGMAAAVRKGKQP